MGSPLQSANMGAVQVILITSALALGVLCRPQDHNLPVLFSFSQPSHNVAVFRGAALQNALNSGAIQGFGNLGHGNGGLSGVHPATPVLSHTPVYQPPARVVTPVIHRPVIPPQTQIIHRPVISTPVISRPVISHPVVSSVEPIYGDSAEYTYEYSVLDDYSGNNFGAKESRSGPLTNGEYYVALPDGRLQTVTYSVQGDSGYISDVQYSR